MDTQIQIALLDTGIDVTHSSLKGKVYQGVSLDKCGNIKPGVERHSTAYHGTHTAGIICGGAFQGMEGIAPDIRLNVVSIAQSGKTILNILKGLDIILGWDSKIACLPVGIKAKTPIFKPLMDAFERKGILVIVPIGNGGDGRYYSPGWYPNILSVGAVDDKGQPSLFSGCYYDTHGNCLKPDILAPGVDVLSASPGNNTERRSGTSMACAYVAGIAARLLAENPNLSAIEIKDIILASADRIPLLPNKHYNYQKGIVNLDKAIKMNKEGLNSILKSKLETHDCAFFNQVYIDPFFWKQYSATHEGDTHIEAIVSTKTSIRKFIKKDSNHPKQIEELDFCTNTNQAYLKAEKKFYTELLKDPNLETISAAEIDLFEHQL